MRPSGVVSQVLLLKQHPWTITTGTCRSAAGGVWYCTYIWLTVMLASTEPPLGAGAVVVFVSPPTKKLPWDSMTSGFSAASELNAQNVSANAAFFMLPMIPRRVSLSTLPPHLCPPMPWEKCGSSGETLTLQEQSLEVLGGRG